MANQTTQEQLTTKFKENYQSIILGALVLLVGVSTLLKVSSKKPGSTQPAAQTVMNEKNVGNTTGTKPMAKTTPVAGKYTVEKGDTLWKIAEKNYDSGYAWSEIASANKLKNPGVIEKGQVLTLPKITAKLPTTTGQIVKTTPKTTTMAQTKKVTLQGSSYTVVKGDNLWSIAVRAYGDGYAWTKIAKANKLKHPNLIHKGNVLKLPR